MADKTQRVLLEYRIAKQSADEAVNRTRRLANEIDVMRAELASIEKAGRDADKGLGKAFGSRSLSAARKLTNEIEQQNNAIRESASSVRRYNDEFDNVSRNVGLAGDVQSNLGALGGIAGGLGGSAGGQVGQGIGVAGEFAALIEEAPRLKSALAGLPSTINSAVGALGASGVGLIGGIGALTAVFTLATQAGQRAAKAARERLTAEREVIDLLVSGTQADIQTRRDQLEQQREAAQQFRDESRAAIEAYDRDARNLAGVTGEVGVQFLRLGETLGVGQFGAIDELRDQARDAQREVETLNRQIEAFDEALTEAEPTTQDLIEAEKQLTQERLTQAQSVASQLRQELQLRQQSTEQLQERQNAILDDIAITQAEISALRDSGDTSEDVTNRIAALTQQMMDLGRESTFIRDVALQEAQAREEAAAATEKQTAVIQQESQQREQTANAVQRYNNNVTRINEAYYEQRASLEKKYADDQIRIAEQASEASADALRELQEERRDLATELQRDERDAQIEAQRDERDALRDHLRNLQEIRQRAEDAEFEAILNRDFASLFSSRRQTNQSLARAQSGFNDQAEDRQRALADERQDRLRAYQQNLADAQMAYEVERQQIAQQQRTALAELQKAQRDELSASRDAYQKQLQLRETATRRELQIIAQTEAQRAQIIAQTQAALIRQAQQLLNNTSIASAIRGGSSVSNVNNIRARNSITINGGDTAQVERVVTNTLRRVFT